MHRKAKRRYATLESTQRSCRTKFEQQKKLQHTYATFVEKFIVKQSSDHLFGQSWFATLTTQYTLTLPSARRAAQRFVDVAKRKQHKIAVFWFAEKYEAKDGYHLHALVSSTATRKELNELWCVASRANRSNALQIANDNNIAVKDAIFANDNEPHLREVMQSRSNFTLLKSGGKGGAYAAKYITKGGGVTDYDIVT